jgi:Regulator of chromosome condensation (RCC1) repeat
MRTAYLHLLLSVLLLAPGCPGDDDDDAADDDDVGDDDSAGDDDSGDDDTSPGEWIAVDAGDEHTCGIHTDGSVECWGLADNGVMDEPGGTYTQVSSGWDHATALADDGAVASWGCFGETGIEACEAPPGEFVQVSSGFRHSCAVALDGSVECWGFDAYGQCDSPEGTFVQVSGGDAHSCGVRDDGTIECWGEDHACVNEIPEGEFVQVSAARNATCGLHTDGTIECWGCGFPDFTGFCDPPSGEYTALGNGNVFHLCAVAADGQVDCWGEAGEGQIGAPNGSFVMVATGHYHSCGLSTAGDIECWGSDDRLQCSGGEYYSEQEQLEIPAESGVTCEDTEPNDHDYLTDPPWGGSQVCPGIFSAGGSTDVITGTLDTIVVGTWDGDNDAYALVVEEDGYLTGSLDWESRYHDLDWILQCTYGDEYVKEGFYLMIPTDFTAYLNKPEEGQSIIPVTAGTECYAWVVGYDGPDSISYELRLWMTYEDIQEE